MIKRYWHNASDSRETDILFCDEDPSESNLNWHGPFATFGEAKQDAIGYHKADLDTARYAINLLRAKKKSSLKSEKK